MPHGFMRGDRVYLITRDGELLGTRTGEPTEYEVIDLAEGEIKVGNGNPDPANGNNRWFDQKWLRHISDPRLDRSPR